MTSLRPALAAVTAVAAISAGLLGQLSPASAVVGGHKATTGQVASIVSINIKDFTGEKHACGGVLRDANMVITTADCVDGHAPSAMSVKFDGTDRFELAQMSRVSKVRLHPNYDEATGRANVALVRVATPVAESDTVKFASLASPELDDPAPGTSVHIAGWGKTQRGDNKLPRQLHHATLPVISRETCEDAYKPGVVTTGVFCAKAQATKFACDGDAGGPVLAGDALVGLVTTRNGCNKPGKPDVYARAGAFRQFLQSDI